ncbi:MAG: FG-GAP-like repeat-containing protein [Flavobacteriaceae bacterium]|nr:FG-GAP-like repeat-containing protein [Flavobacteriaceae bacterium]
MLAYIRTLFFKVFIFSLVSFFTSAYGQVQYSEQAAILGINANAGLAPYGAGVSFYDFDQDGWDDLTFCNPSGIPVQFFKNNQGTFTEVFLIPNDPLFDTMSATWVDYDNDGDLDLFVTSFSNLNKLYRNDGNLQFTDISSSSGLELPGVASFGASWGDFDKDGYLDVFISVRNELDPTQPNYLFKNNGNGTFTNYNAIAGIPNTNFLSFCSAFIDYDKDGWQDIYIANDKVIYSNILYKNNQNNSFTDVAPVTNSDVAIDAMCASPADYNSDGWLDIYLSNTNLGNVFLEFDPITQSFNDVAPANGTSFNSVGWGSAFLDANNDSHLDLYVSGSMIFGNQFNAPSAAFYLNDGTGNYSVPQNIGFQNDNAESFANAVGDVDNDGKPEIIVSNKSPNNHYLWKNISTTNNNWLKVKLEGTTSNYQGIGSWVEISVNGQKQYRYTMLGENYLAQHSAYQHFGIGSAPQIDYVKVEWLSGMVDSIPNPVINQHLTIVEGSNTLTLQDFNNEPGFSIIPNPVENSFQLVSSDNKKPEKIILRDLTGKVLFLKYPEQANEVFRLSEDLQSGLYIVEILYQHRKTYQKMLKL